MPPVKVPPRRKSATEPSRDPREEPSGPSQIRISSLEHGRESETKNPESDDKGENFYRKEQDCFHVLYINIFYINCQYIKLSYSFRSFLVISPTFPSEI